MIISEIQHAIDMLEHELPMGFVFLLDTTDRSFIYKSTNRHDCSQEIVKIDQQLGIDKLMSGLVFFTIEEKNKILILKKIDPNSFLGVCMLYNESNDEIISRAKKILMK